MGLPLLLIAAFTAYLRAEPPMLRASRRHRELSKSQIHPGID